MSALDDSAARVADAAASDEEPDLGDAQLVGGKKKRKPKKKNKDRDTAATDAAQPDSTQADDVPAIVAGLTDPGGKLEACAESDGDGEATAGGTGKKKKKKKKSGGAAAAEEADRCAAAPPRASGADSDGEADEVRAEDGDECGAEAGVPSGKKKNRKGKKKQGSWQVTCSGNGVPKYVSDAVWEQWVSDALASSASCTNDMAAADLLRCPPAFNGYTFTGLLRPAFVTPQRRMPSEFLGPDYADDPDGISLCERERPADVPVVEGEGLETMREACRLGREVLDIAARFMTAGATGDQIDRIVYQACVDRRIYPSPLNYYRFPKSVCVSPNEVICHGIPDCRPIEEGDIVNLDVSIYHRGYHADLNETFFIGECDEDAQRLVKTAYCSLLAAAQMMRPGTFYRDLGNAIHSEAAKNKCAVVTRYCGHGVGQLFHGPPKVPHYRKNKAVGIMRPGHIFTVEPMINLGSNGGDRTWPDNWTAVTQDGKRSAQFEHTFLVTETGVEILTRRYGAERHSMPAYDPAMFQL